MKHLGRKKIIGDTKWLIANINPASRHVLHARKNASIALTHVCTKRTLQKCPIASDSTVIVRTFAGQLPPS